MRLTKLYIHNYKSFYDTTIELDKMNIVVGENNSGKSNLIDVLEFVELLNKDFDKAISIKGGFEKILNYNYNEKSIIIELEFEDNIFLAKRRLTFNREVIVISSIMCGKLKEDIIPLVTLSLRDNRKLNINKLKSYSYQENILKLNPSKKLFSLIYNFIFNSFYNIAKIYAFNTETIRNQSHKKSTDELKKDGSNLGKTLYEIKKNNPNSFEIISNSMIGVVNEIDAVDVQETFGNYLIGFHEKDKTIGIDMVSDGTINLLATITALNQKNESRLLAFDEPERYLHLKAVNYLLDSFRASEKQILITTHSTEILKYANLDEIVFIYRDSDGDTQSIRANKIDGLQDMLKELSYERDLTLDELIADGIIGDFK